MTTETLTPTAASETIEQCRAASELAWEATIEHLTGEDAAAAQEAADACEQDYSRVLALLETCYGDYRRVCERLLRDIASREAAYGDDQHARDAREALEALEADPTDDATAAQE